MNAADRSHGAHVDVGRVSNAGWRDVSARDLVRVPGLLSLSRIPLAVLFPFTLGRHAWAAIGVLVVAGVTDVLDGWYARRFHQQTCTGALLDGATDKVFVVTVVASLLLTGSISLMETLLLATRDLGELALLLRLAGDSRSRHNVKISSASMSGKITTALQYAAVVAVVLGSSERTVFVAAAALTGTFASARYWKRDVAATHAEHRSGL